MGIQGEKELWRGRVSRKWDVRPLDYLVCLHLAVGFGMHIHLASIMMLGRVEVPAFAWIFMALFTILFIYLIFGRFVIRYFNLKSTIYIITDIRLIEIYNFPRMSQRITFIDEFSDMKVNVSFSGRYGSFFALKSRDKEDLLFGVPVGFKRSRPKIRSIENFEEVASLLQQILQESREKRTSVAAVIPPRR